jgi:hypothetical protein
VDFQESHHKKYYLGFCAPGKMQHEPIEVKELFSGDIRMEQLKVSVQIETASVAGIVKIMKKLTDLLAEQTLDALAAMQDTDQGCILVNDQDGIGLMQWQPEPVGRTA